MPLGGVRPEPIRKRVQTGSLAVREYSRRIGVQRPGGSESTSLAAASGPQGITQAEWIQSIKAADRLRFTRLSSFEAVSGLRRVFSPHGRRQNRRIPETRVREVLGVSGGPPELFRITAF